MLVGVRLQYSRTRPGMSLLIRIANKLLDRVKSILAGATPPNQRASLLQAGAVQALKQAGESKGPCQPGKTNLQEVDPIKTLGMMAQTAVTHGATA